MNYILSILTLCAGAAMAGPKLECADATYDFGVVASTAVVSRVFQLANRGDAPLRIEWTRACCGATADLSTNEVAAGTNAALRITLALDGKMGRVEKAIYVMSNDPLVPVFRLTVAGAVATGGRK